MRKINNLQDNKYNRLLVVDFYGLNKRRKSLWICVCDCGKVTIVQGHHLVTNNTKSCGCLNHDSLMARNLSHGMSGTSTYEIWCAMIARCYNKKNSRYSRYGGRGIITCDKWKTFEGFLEDMGRRPEGLTLERKDNNKGYSKENCIWTTYKEQNNNRVDNHRLTLNGETLTIAQWSEKLLISQSKISTALRRGHSVEEALNNGIRLKTWKELLNEL